MSEDRPIGPSPCWYLGGENGEHVDNCEAIKPETGGDEPCAAIAEPEIINPGATPEEKEPTQQSSAVPTVQSLGTAEDYDSELPEIIDYLAIEKELEAAAADTKRLDWLNNSKAGDSLLDYLEGGGEVELEIDVRAAIDRAMGKETKP
jgi:hypothetical protein